MKPKYGIVKLKSERDLIKYLNKKGRRKLVGVYLQQGATPGDRQWVCVVKERWLKRL